jgi:hypothetical protein
MGSIYNATTGALICEICGRSSGTTSRRHCPHNYCVPRDICNECMEVPAIRAKLAKHHADSHCREKARAFANRDRLERELLAAGKRIRFSAISDGAGNVEITFRTKSQEYSSMTVPAAVYAAFDLGEPVTWEQFEALARVHTTTEKTPCSKP